MLMGTDARAVDHRDRAVDLVVMGRLSLDLGQDPVPDPDLLPPAKPAIDRLPRAVPLRQIVPRRTRSLDPEDTVEDRAMIRVGPTGGRSLGWQQRCEAVPLVVSQLMASHPPTLPTCCYPLQTGPRIWSITSYLVGCPITVAQVFAFLVHKSARSATVALTPRPAVNCQYVNQYGSARRVRLERGGESLGLWDVTDRTAVERALSEFDQLGRDRFLQRYGFGRARSYFLVHNDTYYDSKAIVGAAHGFQYPDRGPLRPSEFSGGDATVRRILEDLGFEVRGVEVADGPSFRALLSSVLELQLAWTAENSPEMQQRGQLIRSAGPRALEQLLPEHGTYSFHPSIEGSDGAGSKARVPWIRIYSKEHSPYATTGWYVVFLFAADGSRVYLSLISGTTHWRDGHIWHRSADYLRERVQWARERLGISASDRLLELIDLRDAGRLGEQYERGSVVAYWYDAEHLPDDSTFAVDISMMLGLLERLYEDDADGVNSEDQSPEPVQHHTGSAARLDRSWLQEITLWSDNALDALLDAITGSSPQVVLAGPPGTGKSWIAQAMARFLTEDDPSRWRLVQFHPSYSYESFVEGLRPVADRGQITFQVTPGVVLRMAQQAMAHDGPHVLVIDEMNRANLPKVLGELMFLFEYRDQRMDLQYSTDFQLPSNLQFIGTMNTADRSIRAIDIALRRRFDVFECPPDVGVLERYYRIPAHENHVPDLLTGFVALNDALTQQLDRHHTIGQSFLMAASMTPDRLERIWTRKIYPLIEEYFFDMPDVAERFRIGTFWKSVASSG